MRKLILAFFVCILAATPAMAQEMLCASDASPSEAQNFAPRRGPWGPGGPGYGRGYYVQWRDVFTGQSISGWQFSATPTCGNASNCACGGQYYCGQFGAGQQVLYWDLGCYNRPRTIVCDVQSAR